MLRIANMKEEDCQKVVSWNEGKDAMFLEQWAGRGYTFPITEEQLKNRIKTSLTKDPSSDFIIYSIMNSSSEEVIGTIELFKIDKTKGTATIGRYLINEIYRGKGYGQKALKELVKKVFDEFGLNKLTLNVFDYNIGAFECYKKAGFAIAAHEIRKKPDGDIGVYKMEIVKSSL